MYLQQLVYACFIVRYKYRKNCIPVKPFHEWIIALWILKVYISCEHHYYSKRPGGASAADRYPRLCKASSGQVGAHPVNTLSFLLIGPENESSQEIRNHIDSFGYPATNINSISEGLSLNGNGDYNVAVVDVPINDDNIQDLKRLSDNGGFEELIVLVDSEHRKRVVRTLGSAVWAYLDKPVDVDELRAVVDRINGYTCLNREVSDKSRRVAYLEIISEITRQTLLTEDRDTLLWYLARLINEKLDFFNVSVFTTDYAANTVVLTAFAGGFGDDFKAGYSLNIGDGLVGWAVANRQSYLSGNVKNDPHRIQGFDFEDVINSELAVPIISEHTIYGVIHVESRDKDAFGTSDVMVLETIADQMSLTLDKLELSRQLHDNYTLTSSVNDSLPVSILILREDLSVEYANRTFCLVINTSLEQVLNRQVTDVFSPDILQAIDFGAELRTVLTYGISLNHSEVRHSSASHPDKVLNITFVRVSAGEQRRIMILLQDVTEYTKKAYQLRLLREISIAMQGVLDRDKLLHLILTSVTAGFAIGFNRAFIFLPDTTHNTLHGIMGVGPVSREEAYRIWGELSSRQFTFKEYLQNVMNGELERSGLQDLVQSIEFNLADTNNILTVTLNTGRHMHVVNAYENQLVDEGMKRFIVSDEFVTIPLIARNEVIGVLLADNAYSGRRITDESIEVLTMFASHAGIAIENARILNDLEDKVSELREAYIELEKTHDMLVRNEKLAAIGEVSARLAHEIRNPLATIGGFAKSIPAKYENRDRTIRNAGIIVDEVKRLEQILTNVLDFSKPSIPKKSPCNINRLIQDTLAMLEGDIQTYGIVVTLYFPEPEIMVAIDAAQIKQVFINVIKNAINAMTGGGALDVSIYRRDSEVAIEITDTGMGIPEQHLDDIFEPFFTTRGNGTGLGLSISNRIVQNHQGRFEIESRESEGTTVRIVLPFNE